jgi:hypothetical protein
VGRADGRLRNGALSEDRQIVESSLLISAEGNYISGDKSLVEIISRLEEREIILGSASESVIAAVIHRGCHIRRMRIVLYNKKCIRRDGRRCRLISLPAF